MQRNGPAAAAPAPGRPPQVAAGIPTEEAAARARAAAAAALAASSPAAQPQQGAAARAAAVMRGRLAVALEITRSASLRDLEEGSGTPGSAAHERAPSFAWAARGAGLPAGAAGGGARSGRSSGEGSRSFTFEQSPVAGGDSEAAAIGNEGGGDDTGEQGGCDRDGEGCAAGAPDASGAADQVPARGGAGPDDARGGGDGAKRLAARAVAASRLRAAPGAGGGDPSWQLDGHRWERSPARRRRAVAE